MSDSRFSKCQILKDNILIQNILIQNILIPIGVHPIFRILCMILHKPTGIIFKNRKEAKIFFGTSRYRKIEKEKQEIILIDNHDFIATDEIYNGKQRPDTYSSK